jgi:hypothetical protein
MDTSISEKQTISIFTAGSVLNKTKVAGNSSGQFRAAIVAQQSFHVTCDFQFRRMSFLIES